MHLMFKLKSTMLMSHVPLERTHVHLQKHYGECHIGLATSVHVYYYLLVNRQVPTIYNHHVTSPLFLTRIDMINALHIVIVK